MNESGRRDPSMTVEYIRDPIPGERGREFEAAYVSSIVEMRHPAPTDVVAHKAETGASKERT
jgi:hypothetical protein